eukprot:5321577-Pyramimonas_sp.AAC.1
MKRGLRLSAQRAHLLPQINRTEHSRQNEGCFRRGRDMIQAICVLRSVRSESGRRWMCRDLFKLIIDRQKPNQDFYEFYSEWMERHQELHGAGEPSDEMKTSSSGHGNAHLSMALAPSRIFHDARQRAVGNV